MGGLLEIHTHPDSGALADQAGVSAHFPRALPEQAEANAAAPNQKLIFPEI